MSSRRRDLTAVLVLVPVVGAVVFFVLPILGIVLRTPWRELDLLSPMVLDALLLSVGCATAAAVLSLVLGLPLAAWLAARDTLSRRLVRVLLTLPLVMPPVVVGVALLSAYGRNGVVGSSLAAWFDILLPYSTAGVIVAETYVAMPFFVLTAEAGLRAFNSRYTDVAATLGAGSWYRFRTIVLPMMAPTLGAGLVVAWARALGEFGATMTFAGNAGATRTMPVAIWMAIETDFDDALVLSLLMVSVSATILFVLRERWLPQRSTR